MAEPHWTSYVGMVSGVVGVLVAFLSLYKTSRLKSLDLRLELKRSVLDLHSLHEELGELLPQARKSRESISAAMGKSKSGGMELWLEEHTTDISVWRDMEIDLPSKDTSFRSMSAKCLERRLVEVHEQQRVLQSIKEKYLKSMGEDGKDSEFLRKQAHNRASKNI